MDLKVKTIDIELAIMREFEYNQNYIIPNITNQMNILKFETDMLVVSKSGYATGFEIKVSKSDLKNDLKKDQILNIDKIFKSKSGIEFYYGKFKYFYYAVPTELQEIALKLIPEFCGLYTLEKTNKKFIFKEVKKPTKLHNYKWNDSEIFEILRLGTMRIYGLKNNISQLKNRIDANKK